VSVSEEQFSRQRKKPFAKPRHTPSKNPPLTYQRKWPVETQVVTRSGLNEYCDVLHRRQ